MVTKRSKDRRKIGLALQGGGALGAFGWGVLDRLVEDDRFEIAAISGASAGAICAASLAYGLVRDDGVSVRDTMEQTWRALEIGAIGWVPGSSATQSVATMVSALSIGAFLPEKTRNKLARSVLQDKLGGSIDFDALRNAQSGPDMFIATTDISDGSLRIFNRAELSADVVAASCTIPGVFPHVTIDGRSYWDGSLTANPPIEPLVRRTHVDDIIIVQLTPVIKDETPTSTMAVLDRTLQIALNSVLLTEIRGIQRVNQAVEKGGLENAGEGLRTIHTHLITDDNLMRVHGQASAMNFSMKFMGKLYDEGRQAARQWLEQNFDSVGEKSSFTGWEDSLDPRSPKFS